MMPSQNNIKIIGNATIQNIVRKCEYCQQTFLLTCDDYIFNTCGHTLYTKIGADGWLCQECYDKIVKIKNL